MGGIALVFAPFVVVLAFAAPFDALVCGRRHRRCGRLGHAIQLWFRTQARRSHFRRRQTSSRVATFAEALSSIGWAGTGLAAAGPWLRDHRVGRVRHPGGRARARAQNDLKAEV